MKKFKMKNKSKKDTSTKGMAGKNTGGKIRKKLKSISGCLTDKQIGNRVKRSPSVISAIRSGKIKNPPASLLKSINRIANCKK